MMPGARSASVGKKVAARLLVVICVLIVAAVAAEIGLRLAGTRSPVIDGDMLVARDDPLRPFGLRPGYHGDYSGGEVTVGADGFRVVPFPGGVDKAAALPRVVLLGDSVAFGQGVDDDQTIAAHMQRDPAWGTANRAMVIAVPSSTSWNEYAWLRDVGDLTGARSLVLIYLANDITMDNDHFKLGAGNGHIVYLENDAFHKAMRFLYDRSRLFYVLSDRAKEIVAGMRRGGQGPAVGQDVDDYSVDPKALAYSMEAVAKIRDICKSQGVNLLIAMYREGSFYMKPKSTAAYERAISEQLDRLGIAHFVLDRATGQLSHDQYTVSWNDDRHPSPAASGLLADQVIAELQKRGY